MGRGQYATTIFNIDTQKSISFNDIIDDEWTNGSMADIELSFITDIYSKNSFTAYIPHEFLKKSNKEGLSYGSDYLVFGKIASSHL